MILYVPRHVVRVNKYIILLLLLRRLDDKRILPELRSPGISLSRALRGQRGRTKSQRQNTQHFFYNFAELLLALPSTVSWLPRRLNSLTLSRAHRAHFFQLEIRKKRDILSEKRESGMALKKA